VVVRIFPFVLFGGIAILAVAGIMTLRFRPQQRTDAGGTTERQRRTMNTARNGCWVALVVAVLGTIVYVVLPR
jgi:hypothetical protein